MNSKERVAAALRREPVDRVPVFMWFHPDTAVHLGRLLELPPGLVGDAMGNDVHQTWVNNNYAMEGITHEHDGKRMWMTGASPGRVDTASIKSAIIH